MSNYICLAPNGDGWMNLARDNYFLQNVGKDDIILYFYVNTNSVIIGRNQNAWKECNLGAMESDGVRLVRRHTGGGAVYHDTGNLNFSFIMNEKNYDLNRQLNVITRAVSRLGLTAELSGRNDILIDGKKFSGNAFGLAKGNRSHHGTILVDTDLSKLPNYLNVSQAKIRSKGIDSVRARVCNLSDFAQGITVEKVRKLVIESFIEEYGFVSEYAFSGEALSEIEKGYEVQRSWEWRLGKSPEFDYVIDNRFSFGEMQIHLNLKDGYIKEAKVYSDALDVSLADTVTECLFGCRFEQEAMKKRLLSIADSEVGQEILEYINKIYL
ncbi:MAG: lipoate--protein ligase [Christensenellaceae bacterium]|nr:lipoate--protein ligase [Christensenellaceae bacterium]